MPKRVIANTEERQKVFAALVASEGMPVETAAGDSRVAVSKSEAYRWLQEEAVRNDIAALLRGHRMRIQSAASRHIEEAINTLVEVMRQPTRVSAPQVQAAKALLAWAAGGDAPQTGGNTLVVQVNTGLNPEAADEQRRRHALYGGGVVEATFSDTEDA